MPSVTEAPLIAVGGALPAWCDRYLQPADGGDVFASRLWYDAILGHACPADAEPVLARCGDVLLMLLRQGSRLRALTTPYSLEWRPLPAEGADFAAAGEALGGLLRRRPPTLLDAMAADAPGLDVMLGGVRGLSASRYDHFGNWRQALPPGASWTGYLASRPTVLQHTVARKLARARREARFTLVTEPGPELEDAITAYEGVRARSWKPFEPFPAFDGAWVRLAAAAGVLRMGVLRDRDGQPLAAQHWVLSSGHATVLKLAHDAAARAASPGTVLTAMMIRHLIDVDHATTLDFGRGDDAYKQLWASERRQRIGVVLSDRWHPAGMVELGRQAAARVRDWISA